MSSDLKFCSCSQCRRGRGGGKDDRVTVARRAYRRRVRMELAKFVGRVGEIDPYAKEPPPMWGVDYTD
jgi:hypothetical protein